MSRDLEQLFDSCATGYYDFLLFHSEKWMSKLKALKEGSDSETVHSDRSNNEPVVNSTETLSKEKSPSPPFKSTIPTKQEYSSGTKVKSEKSTCMKCPVETCRFFCYSPTVMNSHMYIHSGANSFECNYPDCHETFKTKYQLKYHKAQHEGKELFKCPYYDCDYCCSTYNYLEVHKRVHTGDNPYTCSYPGCKAVFKQKSLLRQHEQKHNMTKPIVCRYKRCDFQCRSQQKMDKHLEKVHGKHLE